MMKRDTTDASASERISAARTQLITIIDDEFVGMDFSYFNALPIRLAPKELKRDSK